MSNWKGQRILIIGAARQGQALARYLAGQQAVVTLNDQRSDEQLQSARQNLAGLDIRWVTGGHPLDLLDDVDLVCLSGGVPLNLPIVVEAQRRGIPLSNDSQVFMEAVPCPVIGITGSAGKTTTTTLVGRMAADHVRLPRRVWVGGNIGTPLVDHLYEMQPDDLVVLELSSFQLELMTRVPRIGAVLNITPNHLDRHGTFEAYAAAKARLISYQQPGCTAVLNRDEPNSFSLSAQSPGRVITFGRSRPPAGQPGTFMEDGRLLLDDGSQVIDLIDPAEILLRGDHNKLNILAACAIAFAAGIPVESMRAGVAGFKGVPHRLEFIRKWNGASWYNDSIATAPERTMAAIHAFDEPMVLLLGGRDKNLPWDDLVNLIHRRVDHVVAFGEAGPMIARLIGSASPHRRPFTLEVTPDLESATRAAASVASEGDVVLLSPGGTSYDEFQDFEQRGERFRQWVNLLA